MPEDAYNHAVFSFREPLSTMLRILLLACLLSLASTHALAFGAKGHRVSATIAQTRLSAKTQAAVSELLDGGSLASAATWADDMRARPDNQEFWGYRYAANWHFVNIPEHQDYAGSPKNPAGDAYAALLSFIAILRGETIPPGPVREGLAFYFGDLDSQDRDRALKQFALKFLIHLVGDLHQPLHAGFEQDQGGNLIKVRWFNTGTNLHAVWDTRLVEFPGLSVTEMSQHLMARFALKTPADIAAIAQAKPEAWLSEALRLRPRVYAVERFDSHFDAAYTTEFVPVIEEQLLRAGLRLAALLDLIYDQ
ncbi:MAG: S1/P1 nuclease [Pseudomonadales bacterium]|nr:S1/P1 nuclease [Pseudomonadales bacterium]